MSQDTGEPITTVSPENVSSSHEIVRLVKEKCAVLYMHEGVDATFDIGTDGLDPVAIQGILRLSPENFSVLERVFLPARLKQHFNAANARGNVYESSIAHKVIFYRYPIKTGLIDQRIAESEVNRGRDENSYRKWAQRLGNKPEGIRTNFLDETIIAGRHEDIDRVMGFLKGSPGNLQQLFNGIVPEGKQGIVTDFFNQNNRPEVIAVDLVSRPKELHGTLGSAQWNTPR